ncbi:MAG TPA: lysophospholipid acyltransferase family protein [Acidimicrobiia bacterium]|jgi:1-acyl-sn-glycerol-3-phosphate acyltransferase|nr:lysophospholipid acyltransferase family protein [Acidimicrobiia bacterium]
MRLFIDVPRTIITVVAGVTATIVAVALIAVMVVVNDSSPMIEKIIRGWSRVWLAVSGTKLEIEGAENIDPNRSYVVVANHLSALDIMACLLAVPLPIRFLAKKELFRVPVLAQGMRMVGIIEVDRQARGAVHSEVNRQSRELIEKGRSLIIYAEGTRPRNGVMKPFKKGAFTMAISSGLPVLPLSIHGSYEAWPPGTPLVRGGVITVVLDKPVETEGMTASDTGYLRDQVREVIAGRVEALGGAVG